MRVEIKSKNKFNNMLQKVFDDSHIPFIEGCSINSKNIKKGDIFFPLKGNQFNGHDFIEDAIKNGASLIINDQEVDISIPSIYVHDVCSAIKNLASLWRLETDCDIIAITGSNGKTSTKEILSNILSSTKNIMFSESNYNSTIGLPMSIFSISDNHELAILEMGANKSGEIKELCEIAKPNYGLITNISNAHNEYFGDIENIAMNKIELLKSLPDDGFGFINMDSDYLKNINIKSKSIKYGFSGKYDFSGKFLKHSVAINDNIIKLPYPNMAIAQNYLAAYSISSTLGVDNKTIINHLESAPIYPGRGEIVERNNLIFINDTYNSNLASCSNGIKSLIQMDGNKKILVLADMHELGDKTESQHIKLGELINLMPVDAVFGFGEYIKYTLSVIDSKKILKKHYKVKNELIEGLKEYCANGDIIYVKGSRCMKMEEVIYNKGDKYAV